MAKKAQPAPKPSVALKYPYYGLPQSLKLGAAVKEHGGNRASVPKSVLAQSLGTDQGASSFAQLAASAKTWGIVDGVTELRLTEAGEEYFFPTTEESKRIAALSFITAPTAFTFLIERFDGSRLPSLEILANLLQKHANVPPSWASRAAGMFVGAASELNLFDANGYFRYSANLHQAGRPGAQRISTTSESASDQATVSMTLPGLNRGSVEPSRSSNGNVWVAGAGTVRLETPDPMPPDLWKQLKKYVEVLKPDDVNEQGG